MRRPPSSTRTATLFPYATRFRSRFARSISRRDPRLLGGLRLGRGRRGDNRRLWIISLPILRNRAFAAAAARKGQAGAADDEQRSGAAREFPREIADGAGIFNAR